MSIIEQPEAVVVGSILGVEQAQVQALVDANVAGWLAGDVDRVVDTFTPDCRYIESHGPTHHGQAGVRRWMSSWLAQGQAVTGWQVTSLVAAGDRAAYEWVFTCTGHWGEATFDGATVLRLRDGRIASLHEYRRTETPFDWHPA